ncbi:hypothetical protein [Bradyrhizobium sp. SZCCHNRI2007]|uniref:hypothetical protein n=1 Tax=Bradyrhizobium sp. SZCCHNRI2007 TaxID=3057281 RepID=UPI0028E6B2E0|nr:hypothetical protein [Bradyrhizobium sp. SZCCHNRI2007]
MINQAALAGVFAACCAFWFFGYWLGWRHRGYSPCNCKMAHGPGGETFIQCDGQLAASELEQLRRDWAEGFEARARGGQ